MFKATATQHLCLGAIAFSTLAVGSMVVSPVAQALSFDSCSTVLGSCSLSSHSLDTNGDDDADSNWFDISFTKNDSDGTVTFDIENKVADGNTTKISTVYFGTEGGTPDDDTDGFFKWFERDTAEISSIGQTDYSIDWDPTGASQINNNAGWGVEVEGDPKNGNARSTINPGDVLSITFNLLNPDVTVEELALAFTSQPYQELGIAFHVQSIGSQGYSEWYAAKPTPSTVVPTPVAILPTLVSLFGAASKQRRQQEQELKEDIG